MEPNDLAKFIAENVGYMPAILKLGKLGEFVSGAGGAASKAGGNLLDTITKARALLPDLAEGDVKLARGDITPEEHPATRVMDQLKAKAVAEGKGNYTFLGRLVPVDSEATVEDLMKTTPLGELEEAAKVGLAGSHSTILKAGKGYTREGLDDLIQGMFGKNKTPSNLLTQVTEKGLALTKSAKAPKDELQQLLKIRGATKDVVQTYEGVLEREARRRLERAGAAVKLLKSRPAKLARAIAARTDFSGEEEY